MYLAQEVGEHFCQECHCALLARHLSLAAVDLHDLGPHKLKPCTASTLKKNGGWEKGVTSVCMHGAVLVTQNVHTT